MKNELFILIKVKVLVTDFYYNSDYSNQIIKVLNYMDKLF